MIKGPYGVLQEVTEAAARAGAAGFENGDVGDWTGDIYQVGARWEGGREGILQMGGTFVLGAMHACK